MAPTARTAERMTASRRPDSMRRNESSNELAGLIGFPVGSLEVHHRAIGVGELVAQLDQQLERQLRFFAGSHDLVHLDRLAAQERADQVLRLVLDVAGVVQDLLED